MMENTPSATELLQIPTDRSRRSKISGRRLTKVDFADHSVTVARDLIGCLLVHEWTTANGVKQILAGRIVETEAYRGDDPACHAWGNVCAGRVIPQGRSAGLFAAPGTAYIYLNYGIHWLLNIVTEPTGQAGAVLIRAVEPTTGLQWMQQHRPSCQRVAALTNGPGKLTQAFQIDGSYNSQPLTQAPLYLVRPQRRRRGPIAVSGRIGIRQAADYPWRFYEQGNPFVSPVKAPTCSPATISGRSQKR